jgi:hypothetical protein
LRVVRTSALQFSLEIPKMNAVKNDFRRRLARAEAAVSAIHPAHLEAASHRRLLRMRTTVCLLIRNRLLLMGLDPALAANLQSGEKAAAELVAIPDTEALRSADKAITHTDQYDCLEAANSCRAKIRRMAAQFCDGVQPDFARAPVAELLAFCVVRENLAWGPSILSPEDTPKSA